MNERTERRDGVEWWTEIVRNTEKLRKKKMEKTKRKHDYFPMNINITVLFISITKKQKKPLKNNHKPSNFSPSCPGVLTVQVHAVPPGPVVKETDITLTCKAAGYTQGTPSYSWTRAGTADFSTDAEITDTSADAATITYTCTVTVDTVSETSAAVDVVFTGNFGN